MITMNAVNEKNLSEAYTLLAVIADPKGCKERLDQLQKSVLEAKETGEIANREKVESERLLKEAARVKADADSWSLRVRDQKSVVDEKEKDLVSRETQLSNSTKESESLLQKRLSDVEKKLNTVGEKEQDLYLREVKLEREWERVNAMKMEYEEKVQKLKSML